MGVVTAYERVETLRRCVIVGGAGAVGGMFATLLAHAGADVLVVDVAPSAGSNGNSHMRFVQGDITAPDYEGRERRRARSHLQKAPAQG